MPFAYCSPGLLTECTHPSPPHVQVSLVAATNRRSALDGALRRAGRLDLEVSLGPLTLEDRLEVGGDGREVICTGPVWVGGIFALLSVS